MNFYEMGILVVDEQENNARKIKQYLEQRGFKNIQAISETQLIPSYLKKLNIDLICLKLGSQKNQSFDALKNLKQLEGNYRPIMVYLDEKDSKYQTTLLAKGAHDVMVLPNKQFKYRLLNLLEARHASKKLEQEKQLLSAVNKEAITQLERAQIEMLIRLAHAAEYRDDESGEHVWRVANTSWLIALKLGLSSNQAELIFRAARLHDVGKIGIPDDILRKPSKLTAAEFEVVKTHTLIGAKLLADGESELLKMAESIALTHHERWDGSGYPQGLKEENIPIEGRILAVADTFDAITTDRVHQEAWSFDRALEELKTLRAKHFDPDVVDAFIELYYNDVLPYDNTHKTAEVVADSTFLIHS